MAQFEERVPVDPTTMTTSETKAVKREPSEPLQQQAQGDTLVGVQVEQSGKS